MVYDLSPLSLNENTINYASRPGDANTIPNASLYFSSSPPPRGCSGTVSGVKAAEGKFIQSGGDYPYQYTGESLGLPSGRMGYGEIKRYNNSEFIKRSTNNYDNIFPHKMLMGGKRRKSNKQIGCMRMYGGKKRTNKKRSMKKRSMKKRSMKKRSSKKSKKGIKKSKKTRRYRGGNSNVMPTFINEFNTTLSPDESGMASPTPLTRTPGDCTYIKY